jgi:hypothetical protein
MGSFRLQRHAGNTMKRFLLAAILLLPALAFSQERVDFRSGVTPFMQKAADRQLYTLRTDVNVASRKRWKRAWIASWAAYAVANILDAKSSAGKMEANPFLQNADGTFNSGRAAGIKAGAGGALLGMQLWMIHKKPEKNLYKGFTVVNSAVAGGLGAVAISNSTK